jgi:TPR repeat protein
MYAEGQGVAQDFAQAIIWYEKAAAQGDPDAQCILGEMYADGQGVTQDDVQAYKWFSLAGSCGIEEAMAALEELETIMTKAQIAEAQKLAEKWKPS